MPSEKSMEKAREIIQRIYDLSDSTFIPQCSESFIATALDSAIAETREEMAKIAEAHRCGEKLIRHKMNAVDQVGVVATTIALAIRATGKESER